MNYINCIDEFLVTYLQRHTLLQNHQAKIMRQLIEYHDMQFNCITYVMEF